MLVKRRLHPPLHVVTSVLVILLGAAATDAPSETLDKGPYLQNLTAHGAIVCWVTATDTADGREYVYHQAPASGLKPATEYTYYAGEHGEHRGTFRTAPVEPEPFTFAVCGDTRSNHEAHRSVVNAMLRSDPRFVINTGDLVGDGTRMQDWDAFFRVTRELMRRIPYWPVLGNHERNAALYYNHFALPEIERYYSFDYGTSHFAMLDSDELALAKQEGQKVTQETVQRYREARRKYWQDQIEWLETDLETHEDAEFIFATFHHPLYSSTKSEGRRREQQLIRERFEPLLRRYEVTAVFHGHDHYYEHNIVGGLHSVVTGGGGAPLYDFGEPLPTSVKRESVHHFIRIDIDGDKATFTALTPDDRVIETFQVRARR